MNRREMLAGLAACSCGIEAQEPAKIDPSLYIPKAHLVEDRNILHDFIDEHPFIELITSLPNLRITHVPVILDRGAGAYGRILGHISRQNPQSQALDGRHTAVAVFRGPHGYISPTWFEKKDGVPTWNFAVVHASGRPAAITERNALHDLLARLIDSFEKYQGSGYDFSRLTEAYVSSLMEGIIGFEMHIEALEGKFKLGQSWSNKDRQSALAQLRRAASREPSLSDFSERFYRRLVSKQTG
jgi:transcriptional regulator